MIAKSRKMAEDMEKEMVQSQHDQQSQNYINSSSMRPSDIHAMNQATASKGHDIASQGHIDDTKFEDFK